MEEPNTQEETAVYVPSDLKPECRDAYLPVQDRQTGEYERAHEYERHLSQTSGAAGPRGREMWNRARLERDRTAQQKDAAQRKLEACKGGPNSTLNVSGAWDFECCSRSLKGKLTLIQNGNVISGHFGATSNGTTGEITGEINGALSVHATMVRRHTGLHPRRKRRWQDSDG